ncbi:high affinity immunoglobulin epsilon receptor subunit gamma [Vipera latastei]
MNFLGLAVLFLLLVKAEALQESQVCYILDGILFTYGILLTFLYCRLKFQLGKNAKPTDKETKSNQPSCAIYEDLEVQEMHPYSTLEISKKKTEDLPPTKTPPEE